MGVKTKHTDPTLNSFSTDDLIVNVQSGSLFFKSNTTLYKLQGDDQSTTDVIEFSGLSSIIQDTDGNIGIGTTTPLSPLHVKGTVEVSGSRYYTSGSATNQLLGIVSTGSILPGTTSDGTTGFDLGSPTAVWRDLWLSENSVRFVSTSGEVTRFRQEDAKALREGKPLRQETAIGGTDRIVRAQAIYHETDNEHYIKQTEAGLWDFIGPGGNILNIDARNDNHIISTGGVISGGELRIQDLVIRNTNNVLNVPGAGFSTTAITASNLTTTGNISAGGELTGIIRGGTF